jgi:hypothetical protein
VCCYRTQQTDALQHIALSLDSKSDPAIVQKCAHFFVENGQYEKAVNLLAIGKQVGSWRRLSAVQIRSCSEQTEQVFNSNCEVLDFNLVQEYDYLLVPNIYILNRSPIAI